MPVVRVLDKRMKMSEIREKAKALGITPGAMKKAGLIRAIQQAEGGTPCFGESNGQCPHTDRRFRQDCLKTEGSVKVSVLEGALGLSAKVPWPVTIRAEWLAKGVLIIPPRLSDYMAGTNTLHILYDQVDEILPYEESDRLIEGFNNFYHAKAIAEGDKVYLQLQAVGPTRLSVYSSWKRPLDKLLRIQPQNWDWQHNSLRDCIIVALTKFKTPVSCKKIHSEIAAHRDVSLNSIIGALSRYCPLVFADAGSGKWQLADWASQVVKT